VDDTAARNTYQNLRNDLACIGWEAEQQIAWMREHRWGADELALQLDDDYPVAWALRERGWLPEAADQMIKEIDGLFKSMSGEAARWTDDAVRSDATWTRLRDLARQALDAMPEQPPA